MTYIQSTGATGKALRVGWVGREQAGGETVTPNFIHQVPGKDGRVILVQNSSIRVLQKASLGVEAALPGGTAEGVAKTHMVPSHIYSMQTWHYATPRLHSLYPCIHI